MSMLPWTIDMIGGTLFINLTMISHMESVHEGADLVDQRGTYGAEKVQHNM